MPRRRPSRDQRPPPPPQASHHPVWKSRSPTSNGPDAAASRLSLGRVRRALFGGETSRCYVAPETIDKIIYPL
ncbi:hypothetical protein RRG08_016976 [Elysia crispata]|uniref:Uncharacterized protein n=1 Tax=Elysia crispata TaxID=231223 RepID=A0AAE0XYW0_9GAST|nr:hypothetical protein RRG08_016976 [Elysia crispata]